MARHHSEHQPMGKGQTRPQRGGNGNGYAIINVNPPENVTMCIKYKTLVKTNEIVQQEKTWFL